MLSLIRMCILAFLFCSTATLLSAQSTYFVDCSAPAGGDGSSWPTAYNDLQIPLGIADSTDLIVVAQGYYCPSSSDSTISFTLIDGLTLLGGYLNTDHALSQRDPINNVTILGGSLGADCNGDGGSSNSFSVLYSRNVTSATILDGFTITGGQARADCSGTLLERHGGAWYNDGSGAESVSSPTVRNCIFIGNTAGCGGGGVFNDGNTNGTANPIFEKCTFESNNGGVAGGAFYNNGNEGMASPQFIHCKFIANEVDLSNVAYGGACYNLGKNANGNASPTFINCLFQENASYAGGGIYNLGLGGNANPNIINCTFYRNSATANGGTIYANAGNVADAGNADPYVVNSIFLGNTAAPFLGDIFRINYGEVKVENCLFDVAADCGELFSGTGPPVVCLGTNLYSADPLFTDEATEDFSLSPNSPAINAGISGPIDSIPLDLNCASRIQQGAVDLGAFESAFSPSPTPIELVNFQVKPQQGTVAIEWTTLSELNNELFQIERSRDGIYFEVIHEQKGAGTSNQVHVYTTTDRNPLAGFNYYRLVQIDYNGSSSKSGIRVAEISSLRVEIFPNPAIDEVHLSISKMGKGTVQYELGDFMGRVINTGEMEVDEHKTTLSLRETMGLGPGLYFVRVFDGGKPQVVVNFQVVDF